MSGGGQSTVHQRRGRKQEHLSTDNEFQRIPKAVSSRSRRIESSDPSGSRFGRARRYCCRFVFGSLLIVLLGIVLAANVMVPIEMDLALRPTNGGAGPPRPSDRLLNQSEADRSLHPVVLIPGVVSTGLEVWKGLPCAQNHFRQRLWGTSVMLRKVLTDPLCWLAHMALDYKTGMDPPGIRLRPASGLEAADYFIGAYWVWARLIEEFARVGYDPNSMHMASYDWRLSLTDLETRDHYYSRLKSHIEVAVKANQGRKVVIVAHSFGSLVVPYFMKWVEAKSGGRGGRDWVDRHIHAYVNIAGPLLGVPKAISSLLSAESRDTADLSGPLQTVVDLVLDQLQLVKLYRTWGSISEMLPKGGDRFWPSVLQFSNEKPRDSSKSMLKTLDDDPLRNFEPMVSGSKRRDILQKVEDIGSLGAGSAMQEVLRQVAPNFMQRVDSLNLFNASRSRQEIEQCEEDSKCWSNPLLTALPRAKSMKVYCFHGVGKSTEYGYRYTVQSLPSRLARVPFVLDKELSNAKEGVENGILHVNGDGSVPLLSLGYMCAHGWSVPSSQLNPGGSEIIAREYTHVEAPLLEQYDNIFRGGHSSGDHVDIMGNYEMIEDILRVALGHDDVKSRVVSNIKEEVSKVMMDIV